MRCFARNRPFLGALLPLLIPALAAFSGSLFAPVSARAQSGPSADEFEGVYRGHVELAGPEPRKRIPLSVSLVLTDDEDPGAPQMRRISGSFLLAQEGGPYAFNRVTLRIDTGRLELRYLRPGLGANSPVPASLMLAGQVKGGGVIEGDAISGLRGEIGTFWIKRDPTSDALSPRLRYAGLWEGYCFCGGESRWVRVDVGSAATSTINPEDFELEYTPGKVGSVNFDGSILPFGLVYVDYLRERMVLRATADGAQWVLDARIEFDGKGDLVGSIATPYDGTFGSFRLRRIAAP